MKSERPGHRRTDPSVAKRLVVFPVLVVGDEGRAARQEEVRVDVVERETPPGVQRAAREDGGLGEADGDVDVFDGAVRETAPPREQFVQQRLDGSGAEDVAGAAAVVAARRVALQPQEVKCERAVRLNLHSEVMFLS